MTASTTSNRRDAGYRVTMTSRNGKVYTADNPRDAEFLRLADRFFARADELAKDPRRQRPRLRWW